MYPGVHFSLVKLVVQKVHSADLQRHSHTVACACPGKSPRLPQSCGTAVSQHVKDVGLAVQSAFSRIVPGCKGGEIDNMACVIGQMAVYSSTWIQRTAVTEVSRISIVIDGKQA